MKRCVWRPKELLLGSLGHIVGWIKVHSGFSVWCYGKTQMNFLANQTENKKPSMNPMDCSSPGSSVLGILQQEYWSRLSFPPPGDLPDSGITPSFLASPALAGKFLTTEPCGEPLRFVHHLPICGGGFSFPSTKPFVCKAWTNRIVCWRNFPCFCPWFWLRPNYLGAHFVGSKIILWIQFSPGEIVAL